MKRAQLLIAGMALSVLALGQEPVADAAKSDIYSTSNCMGCHGQSAMGGLGPPIAQTKLTIEEFSKIVRDGKGMMPATAPTDLSDQDLALVHEEVKDKPYQKDQIPIAFKVAQVLTTKGVSHIFLTVFGIAAVLGIWKLIPWLRCSGLAQLIPYLGQLGYGKSLGIVFKSLIVDGLCVGSLWKASRFRWIMHGLMLYGFIGLITADILIAIANPGRGDVALFHPLKLLPMVSGMMVTIGVFYVMFRYRQDRFIDNGLTLGADFLFVNLLLHTVLSGFFTVLTNRLGLNAWVMTIYIYHLLSIILLILTAPFSRFQHAWVVPILAAITRLTDAVAQEKVALGFEREPSPGRHHKSEQIAASVMNALGQDYSKEDFVLRYYP